MVSTQLSLFDAATVIQPTYKVGDRVKVKRKTAHAPLLKKGDIVRIEAIHPHNGSCKFWNEVTESWGYLYPEEFVVLPPADKDDSVSTGNAQIADTEYTAETAGNDDSVSTGNAQIVDTEYTAETGVNDDSVSTGNAQIADTEYTAETAGNDDSVSRAISTYQPRGTARSGKYFRFSYRDGTRMRHIHIRGGNTDSPIAQAKVLEVRSLLAAGTPLPEIAAMLKVKKVLPKVGIASPPDRHWSNCHF
jgi:hypothetical protein